MIHFDTTWFGGVKINGKKYFQVLVIGEEIKERESKRMEEEYGTTHLVASWEVEELLSNKPQIIIIGTGQSGVLKVQEEVKTKFKNAEVEVIILETPQAIEEFNKFYGQGKKVNALIHTTC